MTEDMNLGKLKEFVTNLGEQVTDVKDVIKSISGSFIDIKKIIKDDKESIFKKIENMNQDLNKDGKISELEKMTVKTIQNLAEKAQKNTVWILAIILGFLLLSAILNKYGIPLF